MDRSPMDKTSPPPPLPARTAGTEGEWNGDWARHWPGFETDWRWRALLETLDHFDLARFLSEPAYRRRINQVLDLLSDDEFETFRRKYTRRYILH